MGAYKRDVVVVIKMGAYIHGVLILCGCLLSRFYGSLCAKVHVHMHKGRGHTTRMLNPLNPDFFHLRLVLAYTCL